jgi:hypothetical protein
MLATGYGIYLSHDDLLQYFKNSNYRNQFNEILEKHHIKVRQNWYENKVFITNIGDINRIDSQFFENLSKMGKIFNKNIEYRTFNV